MKYSPIAICGCFLLPWLATVSPVYCQEPGVAVALSDQADEGNFLLREFAVAPAANPLLDIHPIRTSVGDWSLADSGAPLSVFTPTENDRWQITWYVGMEGSKQPQDFGVNANLGGRGSVNLSGPLNRNWGLGFQIGTAFVASANAVQVFELLDASVDRTQSFTTVGVFQRLDRGFSWGVAYDFLYQDSFDNFDVAQWRIRLGQEFASVYEVGTTINLASQSDDGLFLTTPITIEPIDQFSIYLRRYWETGANTTLWVGQAMGHSEDNAVVGAQRRKENTPLFGAEIFAPLNPYLAIYGETNILTPVDTGAVDAYLGIEISTTRFAYAVRSARYRSLLPVASSTSLTNDLRLR